ncbi:MAG TPA: hypothetical protein VJ583_07900 [Nitrososphaeraceae archaeon]|nr:hypothetical protein [Nitrososphaeraceae archaeon]
MKFKKNLSKRIEYIISIITVSILSYFAISTFSVVQGQVKEDLNVIVTFFDINDNTGDIITFINSDGSTQAKLFAPLKSEKMSNTTEIRFNLNSSQIDIGDQFRVCALFVKFNEIICKLGENSLAERPEIVDFRLASDELTKIDVENISVQELDTNNNNDDDDDSKNKGNDNDDTDNNEKK